MRIERGRLGPELSGAVASDPDRNGLFLKSSALPRLTGIFALKAPFLPQPKLRLTWWDPVNQRCNFRRSVGSS
jgi:hypothetical protein